MSRSARVLCIKSPFILGREEVLSHSFPVTRHTIFSQINPVEDVNPLTTRESRSRQDPLGGRILHWAAPWRANRAERIRDDRPD